MWNVVLLIDCATVYSHVSLLSCYQKEYLLGNKKQIKGVFLLFYRFFSCFMWEQCRDSSVKIQESEKRLKMRITLECDEM